MAGILARLSFVFAAALIAAGLGDPVVESVSNTGIFGAQYVDNNHAGVIPTLLAGSIIVLELLVLHCLDVWRRLTNGSAGGALVNAAKHIAAGSLGRELPLVFGLQISALFALESAEQLLVGGKLLGGTAWLGGPVLFSLIAHALIGGLCTFALGGFMRALVRAFASIVLTAARFIWLAGASAPAGGLPFARRAAPVARTQEPHVHQIGGRAPPSLPIAGLSYIS